MPITLNFSVFQFYLIAEWIPPLKQFVKCPVSLPSAKTWALIVKFLVRRSRATLSASVGVAAMPNRGVLILCWFRIVIAVCSCKLSLRTAAAFTAKFRNTGILDNIVDIFFTVIGSQSLLRIPTWITFNVHFDQLHNDIRKKKRNSFSSTLPSWYDEWPTVNVRHE